MRVIVFGTFDGVHPGHLNFLEQAKALDEAAELIAVVALDSTIESVKGKKPKQPQDERMKALAELDIVDAVVLGNPDDKLKVVEDLKPDIIALGYDQQAFTDGLLDKLTERRLSVKIIRLESYQPEKYKSSLLN